MIGLCTDLTALKTVRDQPSFSRLLSHFVRRVFNMRKLWNIAGMPEVLQDAIYLLLLQYLKADKFTFEIQFHT